MKTAIKFEPKEDGRIWVVEIDRPPANTITEKMLDELKGLVEEFSQDADARVLIITGAGNRYFIGGAEISEIISIRSPAEGRKLAVKGQALCRTIEMSRKPIIAAINGLCLGGGNEIALACHMRIASENSIFQQPEVSLGIMPAFGATQRLPRLLGEGLARKMILAAERVTAKEALVVRLVEEVVPSGQAVARALLIGRKIAEKSQIAVSNAEEAIKRGLCSRSGDGYKAELAGFERICAGDEMHEALQAFKERRQPNFVRRKTPKNSL